MEVMGNTRLLRTLLEAGADVTVSDADGNFPLHWLLAGGRDTGAVVRDWSLNLSDERTLV